MKFSWAQFWSLYSNFRQDLFSEKSIALDFQEVKKFSNTARNSGKILNKIIYLILNLFLDTILFFEVLIFDKIWRKKAKYVSVINFSFISSSNKIADFRIFETSVLQIISPKFCSKIIKDTCRSSRSIVSRKSFRKSLKAGKYSLADFEIIERQNQDSMNDISASSTWKKKWGDCLLTITYTVPTQNSHTPNSHTSNSHTLFALTKMWLFEYG